MPTSSQKDEFIRSLRQDVIGKIVEARTTYLGLKDQYNAQDLGNAITQEEFMDRTGGIDKAALPDTINLLDKVLEFGGAGELTVLFNLKP
jgi:hypothetical protein